MFDQDLQLRLGSVATDFFLNLTAVAALVALPIVLPFAAPPPSQAALAPSRPFEAVHAERLAAERELAVFATARAAANDPAASSNAALADEAAKLRTDLARLGEGAADLEKRIAQARATPRAPALGMPLARDTDKRPVFFILANGKILPVSKEAGQYTEFAFNNGTRTFTPSVPGDPIASIGEGKGLAAKAIAAINPSRQFVFVMLSDDSFAAFYQLRAVLQQRGVAQGWAPLTSPLRQVVFATDGRGRRPDVEE